MGIGPGSRCRGGYAVAPAPNPDPTRWTLLAAHSYANSHVLLVRYHDATNFEGVKCMVYRGAYLGAPARLLDPHFTPEPTSPIARFRPDEEGVEMAKALAKSL